MSSQKTLDLSSIPLPKLTKTKNIFKSLARSILYQQLSIKAAASIEKKMCQLFAEDFPTPENILGASDELLRSAGVSRQKIGYLRNLAAHCLNKSFSMSAFSRMSDEDVIIALTDVKGIGRWTAEMFLIFGMNRADVLPLDDIGIHKGFVKAFNLKERPSKQIMEKLAAPYVGKRTQLSLYLWKLVDGEDVVL